MYQYANKFMKMLISKIGIMSSTEFVKFLSDNNKTLPNNFRKLIKRQVSFPEPSCNIFGDDEHVRDYIWLSAFNPLEIAPHYKRGYNKLVMTVNLNKIEEDSIEDVKIASYVSAHNPYKSYKRLVGTVIKNSKKIILESIGELQCDISFKEALLLYNVGIKFKKGEGSLPFKFFVGG